MKKIEIQIKEKDKKNRLFTLFNFREELVNFMYKKTIADSSRNSMRFFVLYFFLNIKDGNKTILEKLLNENINHLEKLSKSFSKKMRLKKGEYSHMINENELEKVFKYDIFFILLETIFQSESIIKEFEGFFKKYPEVKEDFLKVVIKYESRLKEFDINFRSSVINDDRYDDKGDYHDLSKSVYRTIKMRTSRQIDLSLHKYAELKEVSSQSPILLTIVQNIDPQIVFDLWQTYNLSEYVDSLWDLSNQNLPSGAFFLGAERWLAWMRSKKEKKNNVSKEKIEFELIKQNQTEMAPLNDLVSTLAKSVIKSNEFLMNEITDLKKEKKALEAKIDILSTDSEKSYVKSLKERIEKLENINIKTREF